MQAAQECGLKFKGFFKDLLKAKFYKEILIYPPSPNSGLKMEKNVQKKNQMYDVGTMWLLINS